jgi:uncharacterized membrane protein
VDLDVEAVVTPLVHVVELAGVGIIVIGLAAALAAYALRGLRRGPPAADSYEQLRGNVARAILLGLEVLVAGDIIRTVAVDPSAESVAILGGIVLIRTFLSFTLTVEATGRWPWQRDPTAEGRP